MYRKLGIFGGSFNPIHIGHLIIATFFVTEFDLDACVFVPNHISPFKIEDNELAPDNFRVEMLRLAIEDNPKFFIDPYEINKGGVSYTFETILHFKELYKETELFLLIGSDQAQKFTFWKNWNIILENSNLVIAKRSLSSPNKNFLPGDFLSKVYLLDNPVIEISASMIRERIRKGKPIDYLVPEKVKKYIFQNKLYCTE
jgi:nicotinate-nucleotide adenylyltransferase